MKRCSVNLHKVNVPQVSDNSHTNNIEKIGQIHGCKKCPFMAKHKSSLKRHMRIQHDGICFHCEKCDFTATFKRNLSAHIQEIHENDGYDCDKCDYRANCKQS